MFPHKTYFAAVMAVLISMPTGVAGDAVGLTITVLAGDGAFNNIRQRIGRNPVIRVDGADGKPVAGASVTFRAPLDGPGGTFGQGPLFHSITDATGQAMALDFHPNSTEGRFAIHVMVSHPDGRTGSADIIQTNTRAGGIGAKDSRGGASRYILMAIGGAASLGLSLALRGGDHGSNSSSATPTATSVTVGGITVGGPR